MHASSNETNVCNEGMNKMNACEKAGDDWMDAWMNELNELMHEWIHEFKSPWNGWTNGSTNEWMH